jgi:heme-degrading monooxygenase HmoA
MVGFMVFEIAPIEIAPGTEKQFKLAVETARPLFLQSAGCLAFQLHKCLELPQRYRLLIQWSTLEDHTVGFRSSENFTQ